MIFLKPLARLTVLTLSLFVTTTLLAHTAITVTEPKDGAELNTAPERVILRFSDEVYLNSFILVDAQDQVIPLASSSSETLSRRVSVALPALKEGAYTVIWEAEGTDTHLIKGELSFIFQLSNP